MKPAAKASSAKMKVVVGSPTKNCLAMIGASAPYNGAQRRGENHLAFFRGDRCRFRRVAQVCSA
jgi:hypothetical protein